MPSETEMSPALNDNA